MTALGALDAAVRQARLAADGTHRPWPLPAGPWAQAQLRRDILYTCGRAAAGDLERLLPPELAVDTFAGEAWLACISYRVVGLRFRGLPPLPGLSSFPGLEIATFATLDGKPGLWLFSLEVGNAVLVEAAKRAHRLPAYRSRIEVATEGSETRFEAARDGLAYRARFGVEGEPREPGAGTLERFLTDRYALYTADGGRLYRAELQHAPPALRAAHVTVEAATLSPVVTAGDPVALFADEQDVLVWPLEEL